MTNTINNISVIGAGAWGTALAQVLAIAGRNVVLYSREEKLSEQINSKHENNRYLSGINLSPSIHATHDHKEAVQNAGIILMVTPAQYFRDSLQNLLPYIPKNIPIINASKGIEIKTGMLLSEVAKELAPKHPYAVLSGPTFAHETAKGLPTAITMATSAKKADAELWAESLHGKTFRPYLSDDPIGAEIGGAVKNVIAIACGIVTGKKMGLNAAAAVMTRGMAEIKRLGIAQGAKPETFLGLSGLGDLTLTCNSMSSRNFSLGYSLGEGKKLEDVLSARNTVAEGVTTAKAIAQNAGKLKIEMPICSAVDHILHGSGNIDEIINGLLSRALKEETA